MEENSESKNSDWIEIFDKIEQLITKKELDQLVDKTIQDIKKPRRKERKLPTHGAEEKIPLCLEKFAVGQE